HLNIATRQLDGDTAARLQKARAEALSRYAERKPALGIAWAGHSGATVGHGGHASARLWVPFLLLVAVLLAVGYWQFTEQNADPADIDAALLADDLPVNAYLDHRFDAWLKR
ncbi:MAG TPA: DUF3619 family protein, partial [Burkholderiales bacterium]|nr:DUF3619 family protein [Burkholderiales bacterium]